LHSGLGGCGRFVRLWCPHRKADEVVAQVAGGCRFCQNAHMRVGSTRSRELARLPFLPEPRFGARWAMSAAGLRLARMHAGGSDRLPRRCVRLRDQRVTVRGRLRRPVHWPSEAAVAPGLLPWHPACDRQGQPGGWEEVCVCAGTSTPMSHRVGHLGCVEHRVPPHGCACTQATVVPCNAENTMQLARCESSMLAPGRATGKRRAIPPLAQAEGLSGPLL